MTRKLINISFILGLLCPIILPSALNSCSKKDKINDIGGNGSTEPAAVMAYYNFLNQKTSGSFYVSSYTTQASQDFPRNTQVGGFFKDPAIGKAVAGGIINIGGLSFSGDETNNYQYGLTQNQGENFYGSSINFKLDPNKTGNTKPLVDAQLYIPQKMYFLNPAYSNNPVLKYPETLKWNKDDLNTKGVLVALEYDPEMGANAVIKAQGYTQKIYRALTTIDNGSYELKTDDVTDFPNGGYLAITLTRANFKIVQDKQLTNSYSIYGYSTIMGLFKLQK